MSQEWTAQEREEAVRMRAKHSVKDIGDQLHKSPKAVERFFERIGLTKESAILNEFDKNTKINSDTRFRANFTNLKTSWDEPLMVRKLDIEFGHKTPIVPIAILPDIHAGIEDIKAIELACKVIQEVKPVCIIYLGDNIDATQLSKFTVLPDRLLQTQNEIDKFHDIDRMIKSAAGNIRRYWIMGNHEDRAYKYICNNPKISSLRGMQMDAMFGLDKDWKVLPNIQMIEEEINWRNRFIFKHGSIVRSKSGYTAAAEMAKEGISGISGHTHRLSAYYDTQRAKPQVWYEGGCLCSLDPEYMVNPNWQHGINIGYFNGDGQSDIFNIVQVPFTKNYECIVNEGIIKL